MNQREVIAFFNRCAPEWDAANIRDDGKIGFILDAAGIRPGCSVLDVACGTGVLFPDYLARGVSRVTGVDISPEMARIATAKLHDPRVEVLCGDVETVELPGRYDCCVVYNAFPHFENPARLVARLTELLAPGGRLTVAHSMGLNRFTGTMRRGAPCQPSNAAATTACRPDGASALTVDVAVSDRRNM